MNKPLDQDALSTMKFAVGQSVPRKEDPILVQGLGSYSDDIDLDGQLHAAMVRSQHAHGVIRGIDVSDALAMPGVVAVYTGADLVKAGYGTISSTLKMRGRDGEVMRNVARASLAVDKVRFIGDPVAMVVAETPAQARDAIEAVIVDIEQLGAVVDPASAVAPDAPQIYDDVPGNLILHYHHGDADVVSKVFAEAAHVVSLPILSNRVVVAPLEPRSAIGDYDAGSGRWTMYMGSQGVIGMRALIAAALGEPIERLRIVTRNVGGSFGMKSATYPEYVPLLHAARDLGRPVKWTDTRSESFVSDMHGRAIQLTASLALDAKGRFLAVRMEGFADIGAYLCHVAPLYATLNLAKNAPSVYRTPLIEVDVRAVLTNTTPVGPYRGAGRPDANYVMERLIDAAAVQMGVDRASLRRRNHIRPKDIPYSTPADTHYDSGDFTVLLDKALEAADWKGFARRRRESRKRGMLRGIGIGQYLEVTAPPMKEMGGIRFEKDGSVTILTGTLDYGQGHATPFAQVLASRLGVPFEKINLFQADSDRLIAGGGTGGSKSLMASGAAIVEASEKVIEKGRAVAAHVLEAAPVDVEFEAGRFSIVGTDRGVGIMELAESVNAGLLMPDGEPASLDVDHVHESAPSAYPNGCHIAEVEVDPETGVVRIVGYVAVNDFGVIVNPMLVEGQLHGGVVQGFGQAIMEHARYDESGQLVTGSFMDYAMPRAGDVPYFRVENHAVPATTNVLGVKGCGEAGCAGSLPSIMNALVDALGVTHIDMPATPQAVWRAIGEARGAAG
ncbi:MAG: xanthine dehydrogenase family protein molybdopterin-binding subunit [Salinarimonadaceae bacterium]|nr:MAG: xanthine dehydrogenase family protein molybdopterin-binding subunit [Salinarimonadaceae bacterium]